MSDVVKKGVLDVKKRNLFGSAYRQRFVVLRNSAALQCKTVEIQDYEDSEEAPEIIRLNDVWTVQDRFSKTRGRYAFELVMGEEAVLTFSCTSVMEREEWTRAFRVLNQLAQPYGSSQQVTLPITDYFPVTLVKNRSALEIGHFGPYLLSFRDSAIVLHWRSTLAIAHHWPRKSVVRLNMEREKEGKLLLVVNRISSSGPQMEFEFNTDHSTAIQVLKFWNNCLLESIHSSSSPDKLNEISSFLNTSTSSKNDKVKNSDRTSLSFRRPKKHSPKEEVVKRAGSFSAQTTMSTKGTPPTVPHRSRESLTKSWGYPSDSASGVFSQDSFFIPHVGPNGLMSTSPPPLPPRPDENSSDEDGPDYAYIDENEVVGPDSQRRGKKNSGCISPTVDAQLEALTRSIIKENRQNKEKKRAEIESKRKAMTLGRYPVSRNRGSPRTLSHLTFSIADPEDYMEPVPSKGSQRNRTSGQLGGTQLSQPIEGVNKPGHRRNRLKSSESPPHMADSPFEVSQETGSHFPPTLPPRTWRKGSTTSNVSTSSITSTSSVGGGLSASITSRSSVNSIHEIGTEDPNSLPSRMHRPPSISSESSSPPRTRDTLQNSVILEEPLFDSKTAAQHPRSSMLTETGQHTSQPQSPRSTSPVPPPLPPRSPIKERYPHQFSSSSISPTSSSPRCPHCRNKVRHAVGKTFSLTNHCMHSSPHEELVAKSSLPDLNKTSPVPENNLRHKQPGGGHRRCSRCSPDFSREALPSSSPPSLPSLQYLRLVGEGTPPNENEQPISPTAAVDTELQSQLDILSKHVQTLEYLETKVSGTDEENAQQQGRPRSAGRVKEERRAVQTDLEAAMKQTQQVQAALSMPARKVLAEKQPPLQNGHTTYKHVSGTRGPPPATMEQQPTTPINETRGPPRSTTEQQPVIPIISSRALGPPPATTEQQPTLPIIASNNNNNCSLTKLNDGTPPRHWTSPFSSQHPPPPIPPRSNVSLEQPKKQTLKERPKQVHGSSKQHSPNSMTRSLSLGKNLFHTDPKPHPQRLNHMAPQSSTVFIHHLGDRRLNHLV